MYAVQHSSTADKTCIFTAYMCRDNPNKLTTLKFLITTNALLAPNEVEPTIVSFSGVIDQRDMSSSFLGNDKWKGRMRQLFVVEYIIPSVSLTNEMKIKGDFLVKLISGQMKTFLKRQIDTEARSSHWAIQLAFKNLAIVAAYMIVLEHVKTDETGVDDTMSLLSPNIDRFLLHSTLSQLEGAYLYYDTNLGAFVRSTKVTG